MTRVVILPADLEKKLDGLTSLTQEAKGLLFYKPIGEYCPLDALLVTGVGIEGHVAAIQERIDVANEFFQRNPEYQIVEFHTHSMGTIRKHGEYYATHFSRGDIESITAKLKDNPKYIHLLVTPKTKLVCGLDNPRLVVAEDLLGYANRSQAVYQSIETIARSMGVDISSLPATRK